jgi:hypothetical protein
MKQLHHGLCVLVWMLAALPVFATAQQQDESAIRQLQARQARAAGAQAECLAYSARPGP